MQYLIVSVFDPAAVARLRVELPPGAFAYMDEAIHAQRVPARAEIEAQGVAPPLAQVLADHLAHLDALRRDGKLLAGGPCEDFMHAINIFAADSADEARALHDADPLAREGYFRAEQVYAWRQVF
jgi:uncharacterized protein YciI